MDADTLDLVGNLEILNEPAFLSVRISRSVTLGSASWAQQERLFQAWRPGATAIGTWWSPAEKMAALHILKNEGNLIFLSPSGFHDLWHPAGKTALEQCAKGRVLYGSPYPPQEAELTNAEKRIRCLALNELAVRMANATL